MFIRVLYFALFAFGFDEPRLPISQDVERRQPLLPYAALKPSRKNCLSFTRRTIPRTVRPESPCQRSKLSPVDAQNVCACISGLKMTKIYPCVNPDIVTSIISTADVSSKKNKNL